MAPTAPTAGTAAAVTMPSIDDAWKVAQKVRIAIQKELDHIKKAAPGTSELARFEKVEKLMQNYRLACIETIWPDIRAALEKGAEETLWQTHTLVTQMYRKILATLQGSDHVVLRRKLEKHYATYLKTAQYFYRGYLQRVCARYDMEDLKRIARRAELEEMAVPDKDKVDAAAARLEDVVRESCHKTLIYLGDLARYRTLLRHKDRKWDGALAYYLLANELIPESGYGHHQCGVIYLETEDHLQVVYHLYRALACARPHPNASRNLEREFRELLKRRNVPTKHALLTWFVKLHAFYSQGKEFTERKELESEVDHRLALALRTGTGFDSDMDLVKIVLVNITAYIAAQNKISKKWTEEGSRSCQFILLQNVRTINVIAHLLGNEAAELVKRKGVEAPPSASGPSQTETGSKFTAAFSRALPLLRIYMAWLCSYGAELVEFRPHLEPQFGTMSTTLSNTLTLLFELLGTEPQLGNVASWRFPEDEITLGIKCLNGPDLHDGCQLWYDPFTRKPKPRREDASCADHTEDDITFTRALDVLLCALDVSAPESRFPLIQSTVTKGSKEVTTFVYLEGGKPELSQRLPADQHPAAAAVPASAERVPQVPVVAPSPCESNELSEDRDFYGPNLRHSAGSGPRNGTHNVHASAAAASTRAAPAPGAPASEFPIDKQLFNILNDFINPPESAPAATVATPTRPAARISPYGMDSVGVAEAFGTGTSVSPAPGSAGPKAFPGLPWDYFYTPEPVGSALQNPAANGGQAGWGAGGGLSRPTSSGNAAHIGRGPAVASPRAHQAHRRYDSMGRAGSMEHQAEALRALELGSNGSNGARQAQHGMLGGWPNTAADPLTSAPGAASRHSQQNLWAPPESPWKMPHGQKPAVAGGLPTSPFSTLNFSAATSSLPQVNSPWGLPASAKRFSATRSPASASQFGTAYPGVSAPSPSGAKYTNDYTAAFAGHQQGPSAFASAWPDARQPRGASGQHQRLGMDIWGNPVRQPAAVGDQLDGSGNSVMQGMPKR